MRKKLTVIDKVIKSSSNPRHVLRNAFSKLSATHLKTFSRVAFSCYPLKGSDFAKIEKNTLKDSLFPVQHPAIKASTNEQIFYYALGIIEKNLDTLNTFKKLREPLEHALATGDYQSAEYKINKLEQFLGSSFWLERQKQLLYHKKNLPYKLADSEINESSPQGLILTHYNALLNGDAEESHYDELMVQISQHRHLEFVNYVVYRILGNDARAKFNYFNILKFDVSTTLTDLYITFEALCFQVVGFSNDRAMIDICKAYTLALLDGTKPTAFDVDRKKRIRGEVVDRYTDGLYTELVDDLLEGEDFDYTEIYILSQSLKHLRYRILNNSRRANIANLLADIYDKRESFIDSKNRLDNFIITAANTYETFVLTHCLHLETEPLDFEDRITVEEGLRKVQLSRLGIEPEEFRREFHEVSPVTSKLFFDIRSLKKIDKNSRNKIFAKYLGRQLISDGAFSVAHEFYTKHKHSLDCALRRDFTTCLVRGDKIVEAANYFVENINQFGDAKRYWYSNELRLAIRTLIINCTELSIPISFYYFNEVFPNILDMKATALAIRSYIKSNNASNPSDINFENEDTMHIFFLEYVCNRDALIKSVLYSSQNEAYDERIRICNLLISRKLGNKSKLIHEAKELSKKQVLDDAAKQITSTKVYADLEYVMTQTWEAFQSVFQDFINDNDDLDSVKKDLERVQLLLEERNIASSEWPIVGLISNQIKSYLSFSSSRTIKNLYSMVEVVLDEYCFGVRGLNSYLSTRVRHGTLSSTLTSPIEELGFLVKEKSGDKSTIAEKITDNVALHAKVITYLEQFSSEYNHIIDQFLNSKIQVRTNVRGIKECFFNYEIDPEDLYKLRSSLSEEPSAKECWESIVSLVTERTSEGCSSAKQYINFDLSDQLIRSASQFCEKIQSILQENSEVEWIEFSRRIDNLKREITMQLSLVRQWFELDFSESSTTYELDIAFDITEKMIGRKVFVRNKLPNISIANSRLSPFVDVLHITSNNALSYSNIAKDDLCITIELEENDSVVVLKFINNCNFIGDIDNENSRLLSLTSINEDEIKQRSQYEGGTGIAKILGTLKYDLSSRPFILMHYISNDKFEVKIEINREVFL